MIFQYYVKEKNETVQLSIVDELYKILLLMKKRVEDTNNDNLIIIDGETGTGKSNLAALICACWSHLTGAEFTTDNVYFSSDEIVKDAIKTEQKIYDYDESLFSSMATDWQQKEQKKLIKMLLLARKKKHFYVFCIPNFFKLKDTIGLDKCNGLAHTYLRNGTKAGYFVYFRKKSKDVLWNVWKRSGIKSYNKYYSFRGTFPIALPKVLDEAKYEAKKDQAILSLNDDGGKKDTADQVNKDWRYKMAFLPERLGVSNAQVAEFFEITDTTIEKYRKEAKEKGFRWKYPEKKWNPEDMKRGRGKKLRI